MRIQTIAASLLALGLLSPAAFAANGNGACFQDQKDNANYVDCLSGNFNVQADSYGAAVVNPAPRDDVGDFVDETLEEKNQRK
jgi:hypothetical protein